MADVCPQCQWAANLAITPDPIEPERFSSLAILVAALGLLFIVGIQGVGHWGGGSAARRERGISAYTGCDYSQAVAELESAVRERPGDAYAQAVLGEAYLHLYQYDKAEAPLRRALAISPNYTYADRALAYDLSTKRGRASFFAGNYDDAISNLEAASHTRPTDAFVHVYLGDAYSRLRDYDRAETAYRQALVYCPRYSYARQSLASIYVYTDRNEDALQAYSEVVEQEPDNETARLGMGLALNNLDRYDEAIATFTEAVRRHPDSAEAHYSLGFANADSKRYPEAVVSLSEALRLDPNHREARKELNDVLRVQKKTHHN